MLEGVLVVGIGGGGLLRGVPLGRRTGRPFLAGRGCGTGVGDVDSVYVDFQ